MEIIQQIGYLDTAFIILFVISCVIGLIRGAVREISSIVGLAASLYLAFRFAGWLSSNYVSKVFEGYATLSYSVSFAVILFSGILLFALINLLISQLLKFSGLSLFDRFLGMLFGLVRGGLIAAVFVFIASFFPAMTDASWWKQSRFVPPMMEITQVASRYIPDSVKQYVNDRVKGGKTTDSSNGNAPTNSVQSFNQQVQDLANQAKQAGANEEQVQQVQQVLQSVGETQNARNVQLESLDKPELTGDKPVLLEPYIAEPAQ